MKTDIDIKDDIFKVIKGSDLEKAVSGKLCKTKRPADSTKEDIVISVLANQNAQIQEAYVNVNIYVADVERDNQYEEDTIRLRELCALCTEILHGFGQGFTFKIDTQRVLEVTATNEHLINNKLIYKYCNEYGS
jgi:hypothetical protein